MYLLLLRKKQSAQGTFGTLHVFDEDWRSSLILSTGELPWHSNNVGISCIPPGKYIVTPYKSAKYPNHYKVNNVKGREAILIHEGNFCGDKELGYKTNVQGCILVGTSLGVIQGQQAVLSSRLAMMKLREVLQGASWTLEVKGV